MSAQASHGAHFMWATYSQLSDADLDTIGDLGFTHVMTSKYKESVQRVHSHGLSAMVWLGNGFSDEGQCYFDISDDSLQSYLADLKPYLWESDKLLISDEPDATWCPGAPNAHRQRTQLIHGWGYGQDTFTTIERKDAGERMHTYELWIGGADIIGAIVYPCNYSSGCSADRLARIDAARDAIIADGVPRWWAIMQGHDDGYYKMPTPDGMQYQYDHWRNPNYGIFSWNYGTSSRLLRNETVLHPMMRAGNVGGGGHPGTPQTAPPVADAPPTSWFENESDGNAFLFDEMDEVRPSDGSATEAQSKSDPAAGDFDMWVALSELADPQVDADHAFRGTFRKGSRGGEAINLTFKLMNGGTLVRSVTRNNVDSKATDFEAILTDSQAAGIGDYGNLHVVVEATSGSGALRSARVSQLELEVPEAPPSR